MGTMRIEKTNLKSTAERIGKLFEYRPVGRLNDHVLNIIKAESRTLGFHVHEESDEMFYVIEGKMRLEFENGIIDLDEGDFIIVPKGVPHRPVCTSPVKVLLIEKTGTLTAHNTGGGYKG